MNPNPSTFRIEEEELRLFRRFYFSWSAVLLLMGIASRYSFTELVFRHGITADFGFFAVTSLPAHVLVGAAAALALAGTAWGERFAPLAAAAAIPLLYVYFSDVAQLRPVSVAGRVGRESCQLFVLLTLFLVRPRGAEETRWFHSLLRLAVVFPYVCAGIQKLLYGGADWWSGRALQTGLLQWSITGASPLSASLAGSAGLCATMSAVIIAGELLSPLAVLWPALGPPLFVFATMFHVGTWLLLGPNFLEFFLPTFVIFLFPWLRRRAG